MSDKTVIILALIALVIPLATLYVSWSSGRRTAKAAERAASLAEEAGLTSRATADRLDVVHGQINGLKDELVRATGAEKLAEGETIGRQKAVTESAARVEERERVEDRVARVETVLLDHDKWERGERPTALEGIIAAAVAKAIADSGGFPKMEGPKIEPGK